MENKKRYSWIVPMRVDVDFKDIYEEYKYYALEEGESRDEAIADGMREYIGGLDDAEYYTLPYEVKLKIEIDFRTWLAENGK
jgi:hypothetical protein